MIELLQQVIKDGLPTAHNSPLSDRFFFCFRMEECSAGGYALRSGSLADALQRMKGKLVSPRGLADSCMKPILRPSASRIYAPSRCLKHLETHAMASSTFPSLWNYELAAGLYSATTY